jgi:hypothetical protein
MDRSDLLDSFFELLREEGVRFCLIGGQAINAWVEPLVSLDLDLVIAADQIERVRTMLAGRFDVAEFPHSINVSAAGSDLRIQIQTDPRYFDFITRSDVREVLGLWLPIASLSDLLRGKVWALRDETRRRSKRQKDLADIARIIETYPDLEKDVPEDIRRRIL